MTDNESGTTPEAADTPDQRVFLVVVDETEEMNNALRFACRRAQHTSGRVALLFVIEPVEFQHWIGVGRVMEDEARSEAEQRMQSLASTVYSITGTMPTLYMREGRRRDELLSLIEEEPSISVLVLGTASNASDPGPLVTHLVSRVGGLRVPLILVPGGLTPEEIDALA